MESVLFILTILNCLFIAALGKTILVPEHRLSNDVMPELYDIHIKPYLQQEDGEKQFTFDGEVNITLHAVRTRVKEITIHKHLISISTTIFYDPHENKMHEIHNDSLSYNSNTQKLSIYLPITLLPGKDYILYFKYKGEIRNGTEGFYRATNDNIKWYGVTQLHSIYARTVLPCFDEPVFKARFRMRISRIFEYKSFFNTRLKKYTSDGSDRLIDHFEVTPVMSTYLLAFVIGDFATEGNEDFKMIMTPKDITKSNLAYEVGKKALRALSVYTGMPYKSLGNKIMQMVGIDNFYHTGMENWGLVLYKQSIIVQEPGYTDGYADKQLTIGVVVHETAHMWFGNSVTHEWWNYAWLNEGFANYYEYFIGHDLYPEYEFDKQFLLTQVHKSFELDATNATQPLTSPDDTINTPSEISTKFGEITYCKGAAVIRMFSNLMGKENFEEAIMSHLNHNHLGTTNPIDFFWLLKNYWPNDYVKVDFDDLFEDWTEQVGYPMVTVSVSPSGSLSVTQKRFLIDANDGSDANVKYTIPITLHSDKLNDFTDFTPEFYLNKTQEEVLFSNASHHQWVIVNLEQSNYYRVFYDDELLEKLRHAFKSDNHSYIPVISRAAIVDDIFAYARSGLRGYDEVLAFMEYLSTEMDYLPWEVAFKGFDTIYQRLNLTQHEQFAKFLFEISNKIFKKLNFIGKNDTVLDIYNRNNVISWLCKYHHKECNHYAPAFFQSYLSSNSKPSVDFRETLYCAAVRNDNTTSTYKILKEMFLKQELVSEKKKILRAMACTRSFVHHHYEFTLTDNVPFDMKMESLKSLYSQTPENIMPVFSLFIENSQQLKEGLQTWSAAAIAFRDIAQYLTDQQQLITLTNFSKDKAELFGTAVSILHDAIQVVEKNFKWAEDRLGKLMNYLNTRYERNMDA